jgi:CubicO group peptidase (beta-lactamase class C family)
LFILSTALLAQNNIHKIENLLHTNYEQGRFNGSALVAYKGKVIFKKGFGLANMEWDIPNAADTKHRLGSITKQFTAMLILQLAAEGTVDLHTPITKYLPDYPSDNGDRVSIHHLLTHTSGIPNYTAFPGFFQEKSRNPYTPKEFVKEFWDLPLEFEPGTKFNYSNSAYFLLGVIIEELTGNSYQEELQKRILDPLGMKSSGYDLSGPILKNRASGYDKNGRLYRNTNYIDMSLPYAAGSMYSTVEDLFLWDRALYTTDLLPQKYMDLYFKSHTEGLGRRYAYGWSVGKIPLGTSQDSVYTIGHGGGINGFNTLITRAPSNESTVILLNNTGGTSLNEMAGSILAILNDKSYE